MDFRRRLGVMVPVTCTYWRNASCFRGDRCTFVHGFICRDDGICSDPLCNKAHFKQRDPCTYLKAPEVQNSTTITTTQAPHTVNQSHAITQSRETRETRETRVVRTRYKSKSRSPKRRSRSPFSPKRRQSPRRRSPSPRKSRTPSYSPKSRSGSRSRRRSRSLSRSRSRSGSRSTKRRSYSPYRKPIRSKSRSRSRSTHSSPCRKSVSPGSRSSSSSSERSPSIKEKERIAKEKLKLIKNAEKELEDALVSKTKEDSFADTSKEKETEDSKSKLEPGEEPHASNISSSKYLKKSSPDMSPSARALEILKNLPKDFLNTSGEKKDSHVEVQNTKSNDDESFKEAFFKALSKSGNNDSSKDGNEGGNLPPVLKHPLNAESLAKPFQDKLYGYEGENAQAPTASSLWTPSIDRNKPKNTAGNQVVSSWEIDTPYVGRNSRSSDAHVELGGGSSKEMPPPTVPAVEESKKKKKKKRRRSSSSSSSSSSGDEEERHETDEAALNRKKKILSKVWTLMAQKKKLESQRDETVLNHKGDGKSLAVLLKENSTLSAEIDRQIFLMNQMVQNINEKLGISKTEAQQQEFFFQPSMYKDAKALQSGKKGLSEKSLQKSISKFLKPSEESSKKNSSPSPPARRTKKGSPSPIRRSRKGSPSPVHRSKRGSPSPVHRSKRGSSSPVHRSKRGSSSPVHRSKRGSPSPVHRSRKGSPSPVHRSKKFSPSSPGRRSKKFQKSRSRSKSRSPSYEKKVSKKHSHDKKVKKEKSSITEEVKVKKKKEGKKSLPEAAPAKGSVYLESEIEYSPSPAMKPHVKYIDQGMHWCRLCNEFLDTVHDYINHLESTSHLEKLRNDEKLWLPQVPKAEKEPVDPNAPVITIPLHGLEFIYSLAAYFCSLCDTFLKTKEEAQNHSETKLHVSKYKEYLSQNPMYEASYVKEKMAAFAKYSVDKARSKEKNPTSEHSNGQNFFGEVKNKIEEDIVFDVEEQQPFLGLRKAQETPISNSVAPSGINNNTQLNAASIRVASRSSTTSTSFGAEVTDMEQPSVTTDLKSSNASLPVEPAQTQCVKSEKPIFEESDCYERDYKNSLSEEEERKLQLLKKRVAEFKENPVVSSQKVLPEIILVDKVDDEERERVTSISPQPDAQQQGSKLSIKKYSNVIIGKMPFLKRSKGSSLSKTDQEHKNQEDDLAASDAEQRIQQVMYEGYHSFSANTEDANAGALPPTIPRNTEYITEIETCESGTTFTKKFGPTMNPQGYSDDDDDSIEAPMDISHDEDSDKEKETPKESMPSVMDIPIPVDPQRLNPPASPLESKLKVDMNSPHLSQLSVAAAMYKEGISYPPLSMSQAQYIPMPPLPPMMNPPMFSLPYNQHPHPYEDYVEGINPPPPGTEEGNSNSSTNHDGLDSPDSFLCQKTPPPPGTEDENIPLPLHSVAYDSRVGVNECQTYYQDMFSDLPPVLAYGYSAPAPQQEKDEGSQESLVQEGLELLEFADENEDKNDEKLLRNQSPPASDTSHCRG